MQLSAQANDPATMPPFAYAPAGIDPQSAYPQDSAASSSLKQSFLQQTSHQPPGASTDDPHRLIGTYLNYSGSNSNEPNGHQPIVVSKEARQTKPVRQEHRRNGSLPLASSPTLQEEDENSKRDATLVSGNEGSEKGGPAITENEDEDSSLGSQMIGTKKTRSRERDSRISDQNFSEYSEDGDEDDPFSHAADILANAKKRLMVSLASSQYIRIMKLNMRQTEHGR